jgi:uncharacterized damage-inducible protein DinB
MTVRDFYVDRMKQEYPAFIKVLKAVPAGQLSYKPHERSPSTEQLVWTVASEQAACIEMIDKGRLEWKNTPPPPLPEMIALFERSHPQILERVSKMDDAAWDRQVQLVFDGKVAMEPPAGQFLWFLLFDAIHHRGQLAAYLRPMGAKVPSIYGPSADDPGT